ncbi:MAG TPA: RIP metalloprotease RseP, partial [Thermoanaerobaculia bacterium]|nr:RIP metalloprotease RseP [Thermoanaerobaculia bacterium]
IELIGLLLALGPLIFFHESGHFLMAKLFRVRVLVFSLGFGKRLFGFRRGGTDYRVSLIPLGGYVRMAGDTPDENQPSNPDEFLSKPKWQRFLILVAGPAMNLLLAVAVITGINMHGVPQIPIEPVIGEVLKNRPAARAGLQVGDRITKVNGETIHDFEDLQMIIVTNANTPLRVEYVRNGAPRTTVMTPQREEGEFGPIGKVGIAPRFAPPPDVVNVQPGSPAALAGIQRGDRIVSVAGKPITLLREFATALQKTKGAALPIEVMRGTQRIAVTLPAVTKEPDDSYRGILPWEVRKLPFGPAIRESVDQNIKSLKFTAMAIRRLFRPEGSVKELSGPINIARIAGETIRQSWGAFFGLVAMISLQLGVMNLLPIPVLDGGHIMILLIEGAARRDLSIRVKERIQQLGFAALAALMIVVLYNDVISNVLRSKSG